jgi:hypothetical protein
MSRLTLTLDRPLSPTTRIDFLLTVVVVNFRLRRPSEPGRDRASRRLEHRLVRPHRVLRFDRTRRAGATIHMAPTSDNGLFFVRDQNYIIIQGFQLQNYGTARAAVFPMGIMVEGACSYIQLLDNVVYNIYTTAEAKGGGAQGIAAYGTSATASINNLTISGNTLYGLRTGSSESMTVNGNVQCFTITNNIVHDNDNIGIVAIGYERTAPNSSVDQARDGTISQNLVYNITSAKNPNYHGQLGADGIYVDGGTRIVIEQNVVRNADIGIEAASEHHTRLRLTSSFGTTSFMAATFRAFRLEAMPAQ